MNNLIKEDSIITNNFLKSSVNDSLTNSDVSLLTQIELCPECGEGELIYKRLNCKECLNCNWSLCGM